MKKIYLTILCATSFVLVSQPSIELVKQFKSIALLTQLNDKLIFSASTTSIDNELWQSDGTTAGTTLLKDINVGTSGSSPSLLKKALGKVFFYASDPSISVNRGLYVTDGTSAGTIRLANATNSNTVFGGSFNGVECNGKFIYEAHTTAEGIEMWVTDGTVSGTQLLKDINPGPANGIPVFFGLSQNIVTVIGTKLYFLANDGVNGEELWVTDGTIAGTHMVKDINVGSGNGINHGSGEATFGELFGELYFNAKDASGNQYLYKTDGTSAGTVLLSTTAKIPSYFKKYSNKLYFFASSNLGRELWSTDGTVTGTQMVKDINVGGSTSSCIVYMSTKLHDIDGKLYFKASNGSANGVELWKTDGTNAGTTMAFDYTGDWNSSYYDIDPFQIGSDYYYWDGQNTFDRVLLKLNVTTNTVTVVKDITTGTRKPTFAFNSTGESFHTVLGVNCFSAIDTSFAGSDKDVWVTDGTTLGTQRLSYSGDVNTSTWIEDMQVFNSEVFFISDY